MLGLGMIFLIALGLMASKAAKPMAPGPAGKGAPVGVPGAESMPFELRERIANVLRALTVGDDGKIAGPVSADAIRAATALAGELDSLGFKEAAEALRAYAKSAASLLPPVPPDKKLPLPSSIPPELAEKLQKALNIERDPKMLEAIKQALLGLKPQTPEITRAVALIDQTILQLKTAQENQKAAAAISKVLAAPPGGDPMSLPAPAPAAPIPEAVTGTATYKVQRGDTGEKIALKFVGNKARWRDLLTTNPKLKDATYGINVDKAPGGVLVIPTSLGWPAVPPSGAASAPVSVPSAPTPAVPAPAPIPEAVTGTATYKVQRGDTGEKIAFKFVGNKARWPDLLSTNPKLKDATYGINIDKAPGGVLVIPTSKGWPAVPGQIAPVSPLPAAPPAIVPSVVSPSTPMTPVESAADAMVKNLRAVQANFGMPTAKGKEDMTLVKRFQNLTGQANPDGKAGPGTLAMAAQFQSDMPLVMYWPKSATAAKVLEYRTALTNWADKADAAGDSLRAANLRASAARERGQAGIVGPMPA